MQARPPEGRTLRVRPSRQFFSRGRWEAARTRGRASARKVCRPSPRRSGWTQGAQAGLQALRLAYRRSGWPTGAQAGPKALRLSRTSAQSRVGQGGIGAPSKEKRPVGSLQAVRAVKWQAVYHPRAQMSQTSVAAARSHTAAVTVRMALSPAVSGRSLQARADGRTSPAGCCAA